MNIFLATLKVLKFPLKLLAGLLGKKRKKLSEREKKQRAYVRNFAPWHYSWQKSLGKDKKKKQRNKKRKVNSLKKN